MPRFNPVNIGPSSTPVIVDDTISRTLSDSDSGKRIRFTNDSAAQVIVPMGLSLGFECTVVQAGNGFISIEAADEVTIIAFGGNTATAGTGAFAAIWGTTDADVYDLTGRLITLP